PSPHPPPVPTGREIGMGDRGGSHTTLRYCTLNNLRGSVQTRSTVKPAVAASCANSSSVYLYELSVQMLSPSLKEISISPMRTVWFFRLTRCISIRLWPGL